jgi:tRNA threonylcarbamoyladenosine biosynthesis protein TsaE
VVDTRRTGESPRSDDAAGAKRPRIAPRTVFSLSEEETIEFGRTVARGLRGGELILLEGDLGLGKTVFAKGIAAGLGIAPEDVTSPSFTLVQEYAGGRFPMFHVDLYRLEDPEELATIGIDEVLSGGGVVVVEWGERLPSYLRRGAIRVSFHDIGEGSRRIEIQIREQERSLTATDDA